MISSFSFKANFGDIVIIYIHFTIFTTINNGNKIYTLSFKKKIRFFWLMTILNFLKSETNDKKTEYNLVFYARSNLSDRDNTDSPSNYPYRNYIAFIEKDSTLDKLRNICVKLTELAKLQITKLQTTNTERDAQSKSTSKHHKYKYKYLKMKQNNQFLM